MADQDVARSWLEDFSLALETRDYEGLSELFAEGCAWRDLLSFTWDIQTMEGKRPILEMVSSVLDRVKPHSWLLTGADRCRWDRHGSVRVPDGLRQLHRAGEASPKACAGHC